MPQSELNAARQGQAARVDFEPVTSTSEMHPWSGMQSLYSVLHNLNPSEHLSIQRSTMNQTR